MIITKLTFLIEMYLLFVPFVSILHIYFQNISNNFIKPEGASAFAEMLEANTTLKILSLKGRLVCFMSEYKQHSNKMDSIVF